MKIELYCERLNRNFQVQEPSEDRLDDLIDLGFADGSDAYMKILMNDDLLKRLLDIIFDANLNVAEVRLISPSVVRTGMEEFIKYYHRLNFREFDLN